MRTPIVALVGRPNVGKSTLFNRIVGERLAIVEDVPGTTRDRLYSDAEWTGSAFTLVDTGGIELLEGLDREARRGTTPLNTDSLDYRREIRGQAEIAIEEADVVVMLVDSREGVTAGDLEVADVLRRSTRPVVLAANKSDNPERDLAAVEFYELGLGEPHVVSALHGTGVGDLLDVIVGHLPVVEEAEEEGILKIAIVGKPNVGKSSLLNALLGQERTIVSDIPGTTRDAIDTRLVWDDESVVLIDTAGIRRRGRIEPGIEKYSVLRTLRAVQRADVVALLIDATEGVTAQDTHIAGYVVDEWKSLMILVNKWDLVEKDTYTTGGFTQRVRNELKFVDYAPLLFISAKTHQRINKVVPLARKIFQERQQHIPTAELNRLLQDAVVQHPPPSKTGKRLKFFFATQPEVSPPTFIVFVNDKDLVHFTYARYLQNRIRERFPFEGTPLKVVFRNRTRESR